MAAKSDFLLFYEIASKDKKRLWLEIVYGRINGKTRGSWNGRAISKIEIYYLPIEGEYIKIPVSNSLDPIPVMIGSNSQHQYSHTENEHHYYLGNYDITAIVGAKELAGLKLVMTCTYCETSGQTPINDIRLVASTVQQNEKGEMKKVALIPENYNYINYPLGRSKDSFLCFRNISDPLSMAFKAELIEKFPREDYPDSPLNQAIHMFCFTEGVKLSRDQISPVVFSFILTTVDESSKKVPRIYVTCLIFYEAIPDSIAKQLNIVQTNNNKIYMPKAICLVSHWPFIDQYREILKEIYRLHLSMYEIPLERVICNLIQEVPLPDQGVTYVQYTIGRQKLFFSRPPAKYLPFLPESCLEYLFRSLNIQDIVSVWSCVMVERKILLISKSQALLTYVALALTRLIYPFKWDQVLISILPSALKNYIETIFPYIIGVSPNMLGKDIEIPIDAIRVDLDSGRVLITEAYPRLPDKPYRQLYNRLSDCANIYTNHDLLRENVDEAFSCVMSDVEDNVRFNPYAVRDAFLEFQTTLLKNYQRFFLMPSKAGERFTDARQCFNTQAFLAYHKANRPDNFLYKVTETSMFANFIETRYFAPEENYELSYFDEAVRFKRTKNDPYFVKPYYPQETSPSLYANDIGFEPGSVFQYPTFPRLNDSLFIEPRRILQLAVSNAPKPALLLKDDMLIRMTQVEWAKFLISTIHRVWFMAFAICMSLFKDFGNDLISLALHVMDLMKKNGNKPDEEIYRKLIEACGKCGLKDKVMSLFKRMKNQGIEPDACTHGVYVAAVAAGQEMQKQAENSISLKDLPAESICLTLNLEEVAFVAEDSCPSCEHCLSEEEIFSGWEKSYSNYTTKCPNTSCETKFVAKFSVLLKPSEGANSRALKVEFLSPPLIRKELENLIYTHGEGAMMAKDFCDKHKILYWNMVLYFNLLRLPYFFLDPNWKEERIPEVVNGFVKAPKDRPKSPNQPRPNWGAASVSDDMSDKSSVSGRSDHSNHSHNAYMDNKIVNFMRGRSGSRKSEAPSDNQSTKSSTKNPSLKKMFGQYIEGFRNENLNRGLKYAQDEGNGKPPVDPSTKSRYRK